MLKFCLIASVLATPILATGCASGVEDRVKEAQKDAPSWFETQKESAMERGYPEFSSVPQNSPRGPVPQDLEAEDKVLEAKVVALGINPKAQTAQHDNLEDPRVWAQKKRDEVEKGMPKD